MRQIPSPTAKSWVGDALAQTRWRQPTSPTYINSSKEAGSVAKKIERNKCLSYSFLNNECLFFGLAFETMETMGPWGPKANRFCSILGNKLIERSWDKRALEFLSQRISIALQRGNACSFLRTFPLALGLDEVVYVLKHDHFLFSVFIPMQ